MIFKNSGPYWTPKDWLWLTWNSILRKWIHGWGQRGHGQANSIHRHVFFRTTAILKNRVFMSLIKKNMYDQKKMCFKNVRDWEKSQKRRKRINSNCIVTGLFYRLKNKIGSWRWSNLSEVTQEGQKSNKGLWDSQIYFYYHKTSWSSQNSVDLFPLKRYKMQTENVSSPPIQPGTWNP